MNGGLHNIINNNIPTVATTFDHLNIDTNSQNTKVASPYNNALYGFSDLNGLHNYNNNDQYVSKRFDPTAGVGGSFVHDTTVQQAVPNQYNQKTINAYADTSSLKSIAPLEKKLNENNGNFNPTNTTTKNNNDTSKIIASIEKQQPKKSTDIPVPTIAMKHCCYSTNSTAPTKQQKDNITTATEHRRITSLKLAPTIATKHHKDNMSMENPEQPHILFDIPSPTIAMKHRCKSIDSTAPTKQQKDNMSTASEHRRNSSPMMASTSASEHSEPRDKDSVITSRTIATEQCSNRTNSTAPTKQQKDNMSTALEQQKDNMSTASKQRRNSSPIMAPTSASEHSEPRYKDSVITSQMIATEQCSIRTNSTAPPKQQEDNMSTASEQRRNSSVITAPTMVQRNSIEQNEHITLPPFMESNSFQFPNPINSTVVEKGKRKAISQNESIKSKSKKPKNNKTTTASTENTNKKTQKAFVPPLHLSRFYPGFGWFSGTVTPDKNNKQFSVLYEDEQIDNYDINEIKKIMKHESIAVGAVGYRFLRLFEGIYYSGTVKRINDNDTRECYLSDNQYHDYYLSQLNEWKTLKNTDEKKLSSSSNTYKLSQQDKRKH